MSDQKKPAPTPAPGQGRRNDGNYNGTYTPDRQIRNDPTVSQQQPFTPRPAPTPKSK